MTREDFLQKVWRPYVQPSSSLFCSPGWQFSKIDRIVNNQIGLKSSEVCFVVKDSTSIEHVELGSAIPVNCLQVGDAVAYDRESQLCYLLSPQLKSAEPAIENRKDWQIFLRTVRRFFEEQGFLHWQTPTLLPSPGIDAHIDFFLAKGVRTGRSYYLPTSPEFSLKKAIADGETKVFEIKSCFRDDDSSPTHFAEFTMIEWYRAYEDKWTLFEDFLNLVKYIQREMNLGEFKFESQKTSIAQLFKDHIDFLLTPQTTKSELQKYLQQKQMDWSETDDWDDLFFRLFIEKIEPHLGLTGPQAVEHFPASQGSLSRLTSDGWADRFEIYWNGIELANAYQEQNNPQLVENRYQTELAKRVSLGRSPYPMDEEFLEKMRRGFPPCAGIAMGLDRLWMVCSSFNSLYDSRESQIFKERS